MDGYILPGCVVACCEWQKHQQQNTLYGTNKQLKKWNKIIHHQFGSQQGAWNVADLGMEGGE